MIWSKSVIWRIEWLDVAAKELRKLDKQTQKEILRYFRERLSTDENPRRFGKALTGEKQGLWRYRVRNYRMICHIENEQLVVLVLTVGHRKNIYL
jgi:mRNA interferase RelE/StbE